MILGEKHGTSYLPCTNEQQAEEVLDISIIGELEN